MKRTLSPWLLVRFFEKTVRVTQTSVNSFKNPLEIKSDENIFTEKIITCREEFASRFVRGSSGTSSKYVQNVPEIWYKNRILQRTETLVPTP